MNVNKDSTEKVGQLDEVIESKINALVIAKIDALMNQNTKIKSVADSKDIHENSLNSEARSILKAISEMKANSSRLEAKLEANSSRLEAKLEAKLEANILALTKQLDQIKDDVRRQLDQNRDDVKRLMDNLDSGSRSSHYAPRKVPMGQREMEWGTALISKAGRWRSRRAAYTD